MESEIQDEEDSDFHFDEGVDELINGEYSVEHNCRSIDQNKVKKNYFHHLVKINHVNTKNDSQDNLYPFPIISIDMDKDK